MSSKRQFPRATAFKPSEVASANWSWIILLRGQTTKTHEAFPVKHSTTRTRSWKIRLFPNPVGSTASKSSPDVSVEIALTCSVRKTRDIPSRSNSKRLPSRAELKFEFRSAIFWIQNKCFPQLRAYENGINNINLQLIDRHQSTPPSRTNQELRLPAYGVSQKNNVIGQAYFFLPLPLPSLLFLPSHLPSGLILLLSPIFLCHRIKDGGFIVAIRLTSFRPPKIRLHCRLARGRRLGLKFETAKQPPQIKEFSYWFSTNLNQPINKQVKIKAKGSF